MNFFSFTIQKFRICKLINFIESEWALKKKKITKNDSN